MTLNHLLTLVCRDSIVCELGMGVNEWRRQSTAAGFQWPIQPSVELHSNRRAVAYSRRHGHTSTPTRAMVASA